MSNVEVKNLPLKIVLPLIGITLLLALFLVLNIRRDEVTLPNGDTIKVMRASSLWAIRGARSQILYRGGRVELWQDFIRGPFAVGSISNGDVIMCLYEFDVDLRVMRIDTTKRFTSLPLSDSYWLSDVVRSSPWEVEDANVDDWLKLFTLLKNSQRKDSRKKYSEALWCSHVNEPNVLSRMRHQINVMLQNDSTKWPVMLSLEYPLHTNAPE